MCGNDLVNIGRLTSLWHLQYGVKHRPLNAQVDSTYYICSPFMCTVWVSMMHHWLGFPKASLCKVTLWHSNPVLIRMFILSYFFRARPLLACVAACGLLFLSASSQQALRKTTVTWMMRLTIMDGFTDELMTGRQSSLTTEKNVSPLSICLVTLIWILTGKCLKELAKSYTFHQSNWEWTNMLHCDHFKAMVKCGYSFEYLNMAADCFPLKSAFSNKHGFGD